MSKKWALQRDQQNEKIEAWVSYGTFAVICHCVWRTIDRILRLVFIREYSIRWRMVSEAASREKQFFSGAGEFIMYARMAHHDIHK